MLRFCIAAALAPFLFGQMCGSAPGPLPGSEDVDHQQSPGRLAVNDTLRQACAGVGFPPELGLSDQDIQTLLSGVEADRQLGVLKWYEMLLMNEVCEGYPLETQFGCNTCYTAIIDQVYGE